MIKLFEKVYEDANGGNKLATTGFLGWSVLIMLLSILVFLYAAFNSSVKKKKDMKNVLFVSSIAVFLIVGFSGGFNQLSTGQYLPAAISGTSPTPTTTITNPPSTVNTQGCIVPTSNNGKAVLDVIAPDQLTPTLQYDGVSIDVSDGSHNFLTSGTANSGTSASSVSLNVAPCTSGFITALSNTTSGGLNGAQLTFNSNTPTQSVIQLPVTQSSVVSMVALTSSYSSDDISNTAGAGASTNNSLTTAHTLGQNSQLTGFVRIFANGTNNGQFGTTDAGDGKGSWWLSAATPSGTAVYNPSTFLTLTSQTAGFTVTPATCPSSLATRNAAVACWVVNKPLRNIDGFLQLQYNLVGSLGDPNTNVTVFADDTNWFRDTNGQVKHDLSNSAAADVGTSQSVLTIQVL